jgi:hypothetical protein
VHCCRRRRRVNSACVRPVRIGKVRGDKGGEKTKREEKKKIAQNTGKIRTWRWDGGDRTVASGPHTVWKSAKRIHTTRSAKWPGTCSCKYIVYLLYCIRTRIHGARNIHIVDLHNMFFAHPLGPARSFVCSGSPTTRVRLVKTDCFRCGTRVPAPRRRVGRSRYGTRFDVKHTVRLMRDLCGYDLCTYIRMHTRTPSRTSSYQYCRSSYGFCRCCYYHVGGVGRYELILRSQSDDDFVWQCEERICVPTKRRVIFCRIFNKDEDTKWITGIRYSASCSRLFSIWNCMVK